MGGCSLITADGNGVEIKTKKSWALLAILAHSKDWVATREHLVTILWPRSAEEQARASLRQELALLRKSLSQADSALIEADNNIVKLRGDLLSIDTEALGQAALSSNTDDLRSVAKLYKGPFAEGLKIRSGPFEDWLWLERQNLRKVATVALHKVLERDVADGGPEIILQTARAVIDIDSTQEYAHRLIMEILNEQGERKEALAHYNRLSEVLRRELDIEPSEETIDLYYRLRSQSPRPSAAIQPIGTPRTQAWQEKRNLTVAAFGVSNPTNQLELLGAEDISELLVQIDASCRDIVSKFGGTLTGMLGDRCIAVFGYPTASELMAERSVFAALQLMNQKLQLPNRQGIQFGCGIANGETLVSLSSANAPALADISGVAVNQACTLSFMAAGGQVLIDSNTRALIRCAFKSQHLPGLTPGNDAYLVTEANAAQNRFDIGEDTQSLSMLTGRDRELDQLFKLWAEAKSGDGSAVSIFGEPGIGKSRLVHAFLQSPLTDNATILKFFGSMHHQNTAFYPVVQEFRRVVTNFRPETAANLNAKLRTWLQTYGIVSDVELKELAFLLELNDKAKDEGDSLDHPAELLKCCFRQISINHPLILVFEDVHWMDASTLSLLRELVSGCKTQQILILQTSRLSADKIDCETPSQYSIELGRLNEAHTKELASQICPARFDKARVDQIIQLSDGIPLFLEELVRSVSEMASQSQGNGRNASIPASLQETLMARIDRMGREKEILHIAAVIGREFSQSLLKTVTGHDDQHIAQYLERLQQQDIVFRIGPLPYARYEFKHALVQELAYASILKNDRAAYHDRVANALTTNGTDLDTTEPEVIARHFERCGKLDRAVDYLEAAGRQAVSVSAHCEATRHFRRALDLAHGSSSSGSNHDRIKSLLLLLGPQLLAEHGFASNEVNEVYGRAKLLSSSSDEKRQFSRVLWGLWSYYIVRADLNTAHELSNEYLRLALGSNQVLDTIAAHYMTGVWQFYSGNLKNAEIAFNCAKKEYRCSFHDEMILRFGFNLDVTSSSYLLWIYALSGRFNAAHDLKKCLVKDTERINHSVSNGFAHNFISGMYNFLGNAKEAEHHARVAATLSAGQGFAQFRAHADINLGRALNRQGKSQGITLLKNGLTAYHATGAELACPYANAWLAEIYIAQGRVKQAETALEHALEFSSRTGESYFDAELLRLKAILRSQFATAPDSSIANTYQSAIRTADRNGTLAIRLVASSNFATHLRQHGMFDRARSVARNELCQKTMDGGEPPFDIARKSLQACLSEANTPLA